MALCLYLNVCSFLSQSCLWEKMVILTTCITLSHWEIIFCSNIYAYFHKVHYFFPYGYWLGWQFVQRSKSHFVTTQFATTSAMNDWRDAEMCFILLCLTQFFHGLWQQILSRFAMVDDVTKFLVDDSCLIRD